jgi:nucleotide-binding universal stress UspA family protein
MKERLVGNLREQLMRTVHTAKGADNLSIDVDVLEGRPAIVLTQEVLRSGHDLLVRSHARDAVVSPAKTYGPIDMQLFRVCPCPVWAIGPGAGKPAPRILAAVHTNPEDSTEQDLNRKIIELGLLMAQLEQGSLTILQAWTAVDMVRIYVSSGEFADYVERVRQRTWQELRALTDSFGPRLARSRIEIREGIAEEVITGFVVAEGIDLVIMGTVARRGLSGLLFGNTAERILRRLLCSVLAVKPDGFVSPVKLET